MLPVTDGTFCEVFFDSHNILVSLEISVHPELHLLESELLRYLTNPKKYLHLGHYVYLALKQPDDDPGYATDDEEDVPVPQDEVHLVHDDIQSEDTEGVQRHLTPPRAVLVIRAARNLRYLL